MRINHFYKALSINLSRVINKSIKSGWLYSMQWVINCVRFSKICKYKKRVVSMRMVSKFIEYYELIIKCWCLYSEPIK